MDVWNPEKTQGIQRRYTAHMDSNRLLERIVIFTEHAMQRMQERKVTEHKCLLTIDYEAVGLTIRSMEDIIVVTYQSRTAIRVITVMRDDPVKTAMRFATKSLLT